ncbi:hypothetical protein [Thermodesulfovibrio hydrogeniphilus]
MKGGIPYALPYSKGGLQYEEQIFYYPKNATKYQKMPKKLNAQMLNDLTSVTQLNRKYLGWLLRNNGKVVFIKDKTRIIAEPTVSYTYKEVQRLYIQMRE